MIKEEPFMKGNVAAIIISIQMAIKRTLKKINLIFTASSVYKRKMK